MREQIIGRFGANIARVRNLIAIYAGLTGAGGGRRAVHAADVLRGATVLLHAALEEVCRSTAAWRFPSLGEAVLNEVPLIGITESGRPEKFFLGKLAVHRAKSVQQVITESIGAHLSYFNVNDTTEVAAFMRKVGVEPQLLQQHFPQLAEMIARRHHIVHQADRNDQPGRGHHTARSLSAAQVTEWTDVTERFVRDFIAQVPDELL